MAPSKDKKKSSSAGKSASATRSGAGSKSSPRKAGPSARSSTPRASSGGGLRVASSQGSRGRAKAGKAGKAGEKGEGKAGGKSASKTAGNKKAASKARKVAVEAALPLVDRPGVGASRELAEQAIEIALDKKALLPVLIDVSAMASYTDFIAILSGKSDRQVDAIADGITQFMKGKERTIVGHEGGGGGRWTLLDFGDIVFHVFYHPVREFYDLESLWVDAPRVPLQVPPEALRVQPDAMY